MDHVLLISQLFRREEGTWGIVFGDFYFHNFGIYSLSTLSLLKKPLLSAYMVIHPKWLFGSAVKKPAPQLPAKERRLTVAKLRKQSCFSQLRTWA